MPSVNPGESRHDYLKRCIPYVVHNEGGSPAHAVAKCNGMWQESQHAATETAAAAAKIQNSPLYPNPAPYPDNVDPTAHRNLSPWGGL